MLNRFAAAYDTTGIKISTVKTDVFYIPRNTNKCLLQLNGAVSLHLTQKHFPKNHLPEKHFPDRSFSRINICQKSHLPE